MAEPFIAKAPMKSLSVNKTPLLGSADHQTNPSSYKNTLDATAASNLDRVLNSGVLPDNPATLDVVSKTPSYDPNIKVLTGSRPRTYSPMEAQIMNDVKRFNETQDSYEQLRMNSDWKSIMALNVKKNLIKKQRVKSRCNRRVQLVSSNKVVKTTNIYSERMKDVLESYIPTIDMNMFLNLSTFSLRPNEFGTCAVCKLDKHGDNCLYCCLSLIPKCTRCQQTSCSRTPLCHLCANSSTYYKDDELYLRYFINSMLYKDGLVHFLSVTPQPVMCEIDMNRPIKIYIATYSNTFMMECNAFIRLIELKFLVSEKSGIPESEFKLVGFYSLIDGVVSLKPFCTLFMIGQLKGGGKQKHSNNNKGQNRYTKKQIKQGSDSSIDPRDRPHYHNPNKYNSKVSVVPNNFKSQPNVNQSKNSNNSTTTSSSSVNDLSKASDKIKPDSGSNSKSSELPKPDTIPRPSGYRDPNKDADGNDYCPYCADFHKLIHCKMNNSTQAAKQRDWQQRLLRTVEPIRDIFLVKGKFMLTKLEMDTMKSKFPDFVEEEIYDYVTNQPDESEMPKLVKTMPDTAPKLSPPNTNSGLPPIDPKIPENAPILKILAEKRKSKIDRDLQSGVKLTELDNEIIEHVDSESSTELDTEVDTQIKMIDLQNKILQHKINKLKEFKQRELVKQKLVGELTSLESDTASTSVVQQSVQVLKTNAKLKSYYDEGLINADNDTRFPSFGTDDLSAVQLRPKDYIVLEKHRMLPSYREVEMNLKYLRQMDVVRGKNKIDKYRFEIRFGDVQLIDFNFDSRQANHMVTELKIRDPIFVSVTLDRYSFRSNKLAEKLLSPFDSLKSFVGLNPKFKQKRYVISLEVLNFLLQTANANAHYDEQIIIAKLTQAASRTSFINLPRQANYLHDINGDTMYIATLIALSRRRKHSDFQKTPWWKIILTCSAIAGITVGSLYLLKKLIRSTSETNIGENQQGVTLLNKLSLVTTSVQPTQPLISEIPDSKLLECSNVLDKNLNPSTLGKSSGCDLLSMIGLKRTSLHSILMQTYHLKPGLNQDHIQNQGKWNFVNAMRSSAVSTTINVGNALIASLKKNLIPNINFRVAYIQEQTLVRWYLDLLFPHVNLSFLNSLPLLRKSLSHNALTTSLSYSRKLLEMSMIAILLPSRILLLQPICIRMVLGFYGIWLNITPKPKSLPRLLFLLYQALTHLSFLTLLWFQAADNAQDVRLHQPLMDSLVSCSSWASANTSGLRSALSMKVMTLYSKRWPQLLQNTMNGLDFKQNLMSMTTYLKQAFVGLYLILKRILLLLMQSNTYSKLTGQIKETSYSVSANVIKHLKQSCSHFYGWHHVAQSLKNLLSRN